MKKVHAFKCLLILSTVFLFQFAYGQNRIQEKITQNLSQIQSTQHYTPLEEVNTDELNRRIPTTVLSQKQLFQIRTSQVETIRKNNSEYLQIAIPVNGQNIDLQLVKANIFAVDFRAVSASNPDVALDIDMGVHYWGTIKDEANSIVTMSFFENEIVGSINYNNAQYTLGKVEDSDFHILYESGDLNHDFEFSCEAIPTNKEGKINPPNTEKSTAVNCVRLHIEADYSLYQSKGSSVANTTNYINGVFAEVAALYTNESISIQISYLRVWNTPSPYGNGTELGDLTAQGYGRTYGDLVHVVHSNGGGGVAYLDVICSQTNNTGASGVFGSYNSVPAYSWDVEVITHELGHNMGSPHTHACAWNGNNTAIDGCGPAAGYDEGCDPGLPVVGTIMSYCHLVSGVGIDFNLGFGQQPGDLIRNRVNNASCLSACGPATCNDGYHNGNETGIDCGGPDCIACPTCVDGIQNGDETGVDCGGLNCLPCPCAGGSGMSLIIDPDFYSNETTWTVTNTSGSTVASGGPYGQGLPHIVEALCLPEGCYDFTIYDSYGDGLFDGNTTGTYTLIDLAGNSLASGSGNFGAQELTNFCVTSTCANIDLSVNFDGFPAQTSWDITDASGSAVYSGNGVGQNASSGATQTTCLADGCYTLNFYDSVNNGMCPFQSSATSSGTFITPGTFITSGSVVATLGSVVTPGLCGNYVLRDASGTTLASGGGGFGASQSNTFCLTGGVAQLWHNDNDSEYMRQTETNTNSLEVRPTLAKNNLSIYYSVETIHPIQINIVDMNGKIMQQHTQQSATEMQLNIADLSAGIYFIQLIANDAVLVQKFIKQ